jgi:hypothetical protein
VHDLSRIRNGRRSHGGVEETLNSMLNEGAPLSMRISRSSSPISPEFRSVTLRAVEFIGLGQRESFQALNPSALNPSALNPDS